MALLWHTATAAINAHWLQSNILGQHVLQMSEAFGSGLFPQRRIQFPSGHPATGGQHGMPGKASASLTTAARDESDSPSLDEPGVGLDSNIILLC